MDSVQHLADVHPPVCGLNVAKHFEGLTTTEKLYAHYMSKAAFAGARIILRQVSPESEKIFDLILVLYKHCDGEFESLFKSLGLSGEDLDFFLEYAAMVLDNMGNYRSSGDRKFIPRLSAKSFSKLGSCDKEAADLYALVGDDIYDTNPGSLGYPGACLMSNYYPDSPNITKEEIDEVQAFLETKKIYSENTRLRKIRENDQVVYELLIASAKISKPTEQEYFDIVTPGSVVDGTKLKITYGDYSAEMGNVVANLKQAKQYSANETQEKMLDEYMVSFQGGSISAHRESQKWWIKDISPSVETNIGFIEPYRDPQGVRAEWEGLVAIVNKEESEKYSAMVERSEEFVVKMPWNGEFAGYGVGKKGPFEAAKFMRPDYTSLEVLTFCVSQIWVGINIPNYDDIRNTLGFKNVTLANRMAAKASSEAVPFIPPNEANDYNRRSPLCSTITTAIHELLGHGSGLMLAETEPGVFNFDRENLPISPVDGKPISSWYQIGQTRGSVFGGIAGSYEECRAECTVLWLAAEKELLKIFGCKEEKGDEGFDELTYTMFQEMIYYGLTGLDSYDPTTKKWGQAHARARFAIVKVLLSAPDNFFVLSHSKEFMDDLTIRIDKTKILSSGIPAIGTFLQKLHIYKSTADVVNGTKLFEEMTAVDDYFLRIREVVLRKKQPRKLFVQPNTVIEDGEVLLKDYEASYLGIIRSWAERGV